MPRPSRVTIARPGPRLRLLLLPTALGLSLAGCAGGAGDTDENGAVGRAVDPGYSASDARIVETGPDGEPRFTLHAASIRQDPRSLEVSLERLSMQVASDGAAPWTLTAARGRMPEDATQIDLLGDVRVAGQLAEVRTAANARGSATRRPTRGGEPLEIRTEALRYEFGPARVSTDADVTLRLTGKWLSARGLDANLKQRQVSLESKVHGRFLP